MSLEEESRRLWIGAISRVWVAHAGRLGGGDHGGFWGIGLSWDHFHVSFGVDALTGEFG